MSEDTKIQGVVYYICDICHGTFESGWSDEDALTELKELWGDVPIDECGVVCDDCWQQIKPDAR